MGDPQGRTTKKEAASMTPNPKEITREEPVETNTPSVEGDRLEHLRREVRLAKSYRETSILMRREEVEMFLDLLDRQSALPCMGGEAWKLVPVEPTTQMVRGAKVGFWVSDAMAKHVWNGMLAAAPIIEPDTGRGMREALEFYAAPANWSVDGSFLPADETGMRPMCGKRARQALAALSDTEISEVGSP